MLPVAFRMGMMAAALSIHYDGQVVGIMLTASHNPLADNGIKFVAPTGEMLPSSWESIAERLAHLPLDGLEKALDECFGSCVGPAARVAVGRDTRPSGVWLLEAVKWGAEKLGAQLEDVGVVSTPEFHTAVARLNRTTDILTPAMLEEAYLTDLATAFIQIVSQTRHEDAPITIVLDGANGVGAAKAHKLSKHLLPCGYELKVINDGADPVTDILNHECGADFVKVGNCPPRIPEAVARSPAHHFASIDGDADRLVYFAFSPEGQFHLIDGDRISALAASTILSLLQQASLDDVSVGVVQTAYANGGSSQYIANQLKVPIVFTSTGVKHLHAAAHSFDIGIYFEANGHGTVLFQEEALVKLRGAQSAPADLLLSLARLSNQLVGDALADLLLVQAMLRISRLSLQDTLRLYDDLPSVLLKVPVVDRSRIQTTDADRRITEPLALQTAIDELVRAVPQGRAFARPSGTEDVVRIFAEASTRVAAETLGAQIAALITSLAI